MSRPQDAHAAIDAAVARFGRLDILVNNAGNFFAGFFEELSPEQVRNQIESLLFGPMNVSRAALPVMRKQHSGLVVTISSTAGITGQVFCSAYAAAKFGVEGWHDGADTRSPSAIYYGLPLHTREPPMTSKIAEGLRTAIAFANGDKSNGRSTTVHVSGARVLRELTPSAASRFRAAASNPSNRRSDVRHPALPYLYLAGARAPLNLALRCRLL